MRIDPTVTYLAEIFALLSVAYVHSRFRSVRARILLIILSLIVLGETIMEFGLIEGYSMVLINGLILVQFALYPWFFSSGFSSPLLKKLSRYFSIAYVIAWILDGVLIAPIQVSLMVHSYVLGAVFVLVCVIMFCYEELLLRENTAPLYSRYYFWIAAGLFIWLSSEIPIMGILNYMVANRIPVNEWPVVMIKGVTSTVYYCLYPLALIWMRTE